ncbi:MAG: recombinase family protein [Clostridiales bacterium]|jgi:DNA invertase Pin-like site-specific DNA recombinase|nr:recombinase family protein [Clostridiales bacterium]
MKSNLITAIYCRSAIKCDDAVAAQELILRNYAEEHGYCNIAVYVDNGYNGLGFNRHAFSRLEADINAGLVGTVLVKDISRVSRNYKDIFAWFDSIRKTGVLFISVQDKLTNDFFNKEFNTMKRLLEKYHPKQKRPRKKSQHYAAAAE